MKVALKPVPDLGQHQITAVQLASNGMDGNPIYQSDYIGRTIVLKIYGTVLAGQLDSVQDAIDDGRILLRIGYHNVAVPLTHRITVIPEGHRLQFTAVPASGVVS